MPVPEFPQRLSERPIEINRIMLDPNNPRLSDGTSEPTPEQRTAEDSVQRATLRRLNDGRFDMDGLRASIRRSGLLPLDRVVVRPITDDENYVVVEGNRRIGAVKTLLEQHASGDVTLEPAALATMQQPTVLVLEGEGAEAARLDQWVIQGIRHVTGIREWGGDQVARAIQTMVGDLGYTEREVADALGLTVHRVNRAMRVLSALNQMAEDDEFGEYATPELYAYFDEVIKRPKVRNWMGWDESQYIFTSDERVRTLYAWISPDEELSEERRIPVSGDVRSLDPVLDSSAALSIINTPGQTINDALRVIETPLEPEWRAPVERAREALRSIPMSIIEEMKDEDRELIESLRAMADKRLQQAVDLRSA